MWRKNMGTSFFYFVIIHAFDRQTDGRTDRRTDISLVAKTALHSMQHGNNHHLYYYEFNQNQQRIAQMPICCTFCFYFCCFAGLIWLLLPTILFFMGHLTTLLAKL